MGFGWSEIIFLGLAALIIFGEELPKVARDAGRTYHELRRSLTGLF